MYYVIHNIYKKNYFFINSRCQHSRVVKGVRLKIGCVSFAGSNPAADNPPKIYILNS